jgi:endonuclease/exonuclease/phosphatase family metal-dependent hydrolase
MDFFYEDGERVRPEGDEYKTYQDGIFSIMNDFNHADFILLQEVDIKAKRSYFTNQVEMFHESLPDYSKVFAKNYDVKFVPVPVASPMGSVKSGLLLFSRYIPEKAQRYAFPPDESWPLRLFQLNRCFIFTSFSYDDKNLVVINTHNSAFDETGEAKAIQLNILKELMVNMYEKGYYVVAGGDWNQNPPDYIAQRIITGDVVKTIDPLIPSDLLPQGWTWAYDPEIPTNRNIDITYEKGITKTTIIDYFVVSPNVEILEVKTTSTSFEYTDHQPVFLKVRLISDK